MVGLIKLLEKYWGFHTFLPLQREIIESLFERSGYSSDNGDGKQGTQL